MLELNHVGYTTEDGMEILKDITLKIDERFVAITGPNGGGKSTLAKVIAGIYQPTEGTILLDGVDITNMSITNRAKEGISFAFQQPVRFKGLKVRDLLRLAAGKDAKYSELKGYLERAENGHANNFKYNELDTNFFIRAKGGALVHYLEPLSRDLDDRG